MFCNIGNVRVSIRLSIMFVGTLMLCTNIQSALLINDCKL